MLIELAVRNVRRQRGRSAMALAAIALGVAALVVAGGFIKDTVVELGESMIRSQSGHLQLSVRGFRDRGTSEDAAYLLDNGQALRERLSILPGVEEVMLRREFSGLLSHGRGEWVIAGEGIEPAAEARLGTYVDIASGRQLEESDLYGMMIGAGVASALDLEVGDWANLLVNTTEGAANVLEFQVVGIFQTFSKDYDARAVRIPLAATGDLMQDPDVHLAVLLLEDTSLTLPLKSLISASPEWSGLEVYDWQDLNPFYRQTVDLYIQQFGFLLLVILLMLGLSVSNAINMNVHERAAEFGTMLACGARRSEIYRLVLLESALMGLAGAVLGVTAGNLLALLISAIGIPMPPPPNSDLAYTALVLLDWRLSLMAGLVGFLAPLFAALRPARRTARCDIAEALRQGI